MKELHYCTLLLMCIVIVHLIALAHLQKRYTPTRYAISKSTKFVGFYMNWGRLGNQLFHLITGYGIARSLNRTHYLSLQDDAFFHVASYLRQFKSVFPRLDKTFIVAPYDANETFVPFSTLCCIYDDPRRLLNRTERYLHLQLTYGQNPRYFEEYIDEVREYLQFSEKIQKEGNDLLRRLNITHPSFMCIHIRRGDFITRNIATDMEATIEAAQSIAKLKNISNFLIFGDDKYFMQKMSMWLVSDEDSNEGAALVSNFNEIMDLYVSSRACSSFLIAAVTSTFGWWLAFFIPNQNDVFYMPDTRPHADKMPNKELFLKQWKEYSE